MAKLRHMHGFLLYVLCIGYIKSEDPRFYDPHGLPLLTPRQSKRVVPVQEHICPIISWAKTFTPVLDPCSESHRPDSDSADKSITLLGYGSELFEMIEALKCKGSKRDIKVNFILYRNGMFTFQDCFYADSKLLQLELKWHRVYYHLNQWNCAQLDSEPHWCCNNLIMIPNKKESEMLKRADASNLHLKCFPNMCHGSHIVTNYCQDPSNSIYKDKHNIIEYYTNFKEDKSENNDDKIKDLLVNNELLNTQVSNRDLYKHNEVYIPPERHVICPLKLTFKNQQNRYYTHPPGNIYLALSAAEKTQYDPRVEDPITEDLNTYNNYYADKCKTNQNLINNNDFQNTWCPYLYTLKTNPFCICNQLRQSNAQNTNFETASISNNLLCRYQAKRIDYYSYAIPVPTMLHAKNNFNYCVTKLALPKYENIITNPVYTNHIHPQSTMHLLENSKHYVSLPLNLNMVRDISQYYNPSESLQHKEYVFANRYKDSKIPTYSMNNENIIATDLPVYKTFSCGNYQKEGDYINSVLVRPAVDYSSNYQPYTYNNDSQTLVQYVPNIEKAIATIPDSCHHTNNVAIESNDNELNEISNSDHNSYYCSHYSTIPTPNSVNNYFLFKNPFVVSPANVVLPNFDLNTRLSTNITKPNFVSPIVINPAPVLLNNVPNPWLNYYLNRDIGNNEFHKSLNKYYDCGSYKDTFSTNRDSIATDYYYTSKNPQSCLDPTFDVSQMNIAQKPTLITPNNLLTKSSIFDSKRLITYKNKNVPYTRSKDSTPIGGVNLDKSNTFGIPNELDLSKFAYGNYIDMHTHTLDNLAKVPIPTQQHKEYLPYDNYNAQPESEVNKFDNYEYLQEPIAKIYNQNQLPNQNICYHSQKIPIAPVLHSKPTLTYDFPTTKTYYAYKPNTDLQYEIIHELPIQINKNHPAERAFVLKSPQMRFIYLKSTPEHIKHKYSNGIADPSRNVENNLVTDFENDKSFCPYTSQLIPHQYSEMLPLQSTPILNNNVPINSYSYNSITPLQSTYISKTLVPYKPIVDLNLRCFNNYAANTVMHYLPSLSNTSPINHNKNAMRPMNYIPPTIQNYPFQYTPQTMSKIILPKSLLTNRYVNQDIGSMLYFNIPNYKNPYDLNISAAPFKPIIAEFIDCKAKDIKLNDYSFKNSYSPKLKANSVIECPQIASTAINIKLSEAPNTPNIKVASDIGTISKTTPPFQSFYTPFSQNILKSNIPIITYICDKPNKHSIQGKKPFKPIHNQYQTNHIPAVISQQPHNIYLAPEAVSGQLAKKYNQVATSPLYKNYDEPIQYLTPKCSNFAYIPISPTLPTTNYLTNNYEYSQIKQKTPQNANKTPTFKNNKANYYWATHDAYYETVTPETHVTLVNKQIQNYYNIRELPELVYAIKPASEIAKPIILQSKYRSQKPLSPIHLKKSFTFPLRPITATNDLSQSPEFSPIIWESPRKATTPICSNKIKTEPVNYYTPQKMITPNIYNKITRPEIYVTPGFQPCETLSNVRGLLKIMSSGKPTSNITEPAVRQLEYPSKEPLSPMYPQKNLATSLQPITTTNDPIQSFVNSPIVSENRPNMLICPSNINTKPVNYWTSMRYYQEAKPETIFTTDYKPCETFNDLGLKPRLVTPDSYSKEPTTWQSEYPSKEYFSPIYLQKPLPTSLQPTTTKDLTQSLEYSPMISKSQPNINIYPINTNSKPVYSPPCKRYDQNSYYQKSSPEFYVSPKSRSEIQITPNYKLYKTSNNVRELLPKMTQTEKATSQETEPTVSHLDYSLDPSSPLYFKKPLSLTVQPITTRNDITKRFKYSPSNINTMPANHWTPSKHYYETARPDFIVTPDYKSCISYYIRAQPELMSPIKPIICRTEPANNQLEYPIKEPLSPIYLQKPLTTSRPPITTTNDPTQNFVYCPIISKSQPNILIRPSNINTKSVNYWTPRKRYYQEARPETFSDYKPCETFKAIRIKPVLVPPGKPEYKLCKKLDNIRTQLISPESPTEPTIWQSTYPSKPCNNYHKIGTQPELTYPSKPTSYATELAIRQAEYPSRDPLPSTYLQKPLTTSLQSTTTNDRTQSLNYAPNIFESQPNIHICPNNIFTKPNNDWSPHKNHYQNNYYQTARPEILVTTNYKPCETFNNIRMKPRLVCTGKPMIYATEPAICQLEYPPKDPLLPIYLQKPLATSLQPITITNHRIQCLEYNPTISESKPITHICPNNIINKPLKYWTPCKLSNVYAESSVDSNPTYFYQTTRPEVHTTPNYKLCTNYRNIKVHPEIVSPVKAMSYNTDPDNNPLEYALEDPSSPIQKPFTSSQLPITTNDIRKSFEYNPVISDSPQQTNTHICASNMNNKAVNYWMPCNHYYQKAKPEMHVTPDFKPCKNYFNIGIKPKLVSQVKHICFTKEPKIGQLEYPSIELWRPLNFKKPFNPSLQPTMIINDPTQSFIYSPFIPESQPNMHICQSNVNSKPVYYRSLRKRYYPGNYYQKPNIEVFVTPDYKPCCNYENIEKQLESPVPGKTRSFMTKSAIWPSEYPSNNPTSPMLYKKVPLTPSDVLLLPQKTPTNDLRVEQSMVYNPIILKSQPTKYICPSNINTKPVNYWTSRKLYYPNSNHQTASPEIKVAQGSKPKMHVTPDYTLYKTSKNERMVLPIKIPPSKSTCYTTQSVVSSQLEKPPKEPLSSIYLQKPLTTSLRAIPSTNDRIQSLEYSPLTSDSQPNRHICPNNIKTEPVNYWPRKYYYPNTYYQTAEAEALVFPDYKRSEIIHDIRIKPRLVSPAICQLEYTTKQPSSPMYLKKPLTTFMQPYYWYTTNYHTQNFEYSPIKLASPQKATSFICPSYFKTEPINYWTSRNNNVLYKYHQITRPDIQVSTDLLPYQTFYSKRTQLVAPEKPTSYNNTESTTWQSEYPLEDPSSPIYSTNKPSPMPYSQPNNIYSVKDNAQAVTSTSFSDQSPNSYDAGNSIMFDPNRDFNGFSIKPIFESQYKSTKTPLTRTPPTVTCSSMYYKKYYSPIFLLSPITSYYYKSSVPLKPKSYSKKPIGYPPQDTTNKNKLADTVASPFYPYSPSNHQPAYIVQKTPKRRLFNRPLFGPFAKTYVKPKVTYSTIPNINLRQEFTHEPNYNVPDVQPTKQYNQKNRNKNPQSISSILQLRAQTSYSTNFSPRIKYPIVKSIKIPSSTNYYPNMIQRTLQSEQNSKSNINDNLLVPAMLKFKSYTTHGNAKLYYNNEITALQPADISLTTSTFDKIKPSDTVHKKPTDPFSSPPTYDVSGFYKSQTLPYSIEKDSQFVSEYTNLKKTFPYKSIVTFPSKPFANSAVIKPKAGNYAAVNVIQNLAATCPKTANNISPKQLYTTTRNAKIREALSSSITDIPVAQSTQSKSENYFSPNAVLTFLSKPYANSAYIKPIVEYAAAASVMESPLHDSKAHTAAAYTANNVPFIYTSTGHANMNQAFPIKINSYNEQTYKKAENIWYIPKTAKIAKHLHAPYSKLLPTYKQSHCQNKNPSMVDYFGRNMPSKTHTVITPFSGTNTPMISSHGHLFLEYLSPENNYPCYSQPNTKFNQHHEGYQKNVVTLKPIATIKTNNLDAIKSDGGDPNSYSLNAVPISTCIIGQSSSKPIYQVSGSESHVTPSLKSKLGTANVKPPSANYFKTGQGYNGIYYFNPNLYSSEKPSDYTHEIRKFTSSVVPGTIPCLNTEALYLNPNSMVISEPIRIRCDALINIPMYYTQNSQLIKPENVREDAKLKKNYVWTKNLKPYVCSVFPERINTKTGTVCVTNHENSYIPNFEIYKTSDNPFGNKKNQPYSASSNVVPSAVWFWKPHSIAYVLNLISRVFNSNPWSTQSINGLPSSPSTSTLTPTETPFNLQRFSARILTVNHIPSPILLYSISNGLQYKPLCYYSEQNRYQFLNLSPGNFVSVCPIINNNQQLGNALCLKSNYYLQNRGNGNINTLKYINVDNTLANQIKTNILNRGITNNLLYMHQVDMNKLYNVQYPNNEIAIQLGNIGIAKCMFNSGEQAVTLTTDDPNIDIRAWRSKLRLVKAKLVLDYQDFPVTNFVPIIKNSHKYSVYFVQNKAKQFITKRYGELVWNGIVMNSKPYALVNDVNYIDLMSGKCNILWSTYSMMYLQPQHYCTRKYYWSVIIPMV